MEVTGYEFCQNNNYHYYHQQESSSTESRAEWQTTEHRLVRNFGLLRSLLWTGKLISRVCHNLWRQLMTSPSPSHPNRRIYFQHTQKPKSVPWPENRLGNKTERYHPTGKCTLRAYGKLRALVYDILPPAFGGRVPESDARSVGLWICTLRRRQPWTTRSNSLITSVCLVDRGGFVKR